MGRLAAVAHQFFGGVYERFEVRDVEALDFERPDPELATMICTDPGTPPLIDGISFVDFDR